MTVVGCVSVKGVSKSTGRPYSGYRLYLTYPAKDVDGFGVRTIDQYISDELFSDYFVFDDSILGLEIDFLYNRFGSVIGINAL